MANDGQMTLSTYQEIDACPGRIAAEETARAAADAKHDAAIAEAIDAGPKNKFKLTTRIGTSNTNASSTYTIGGLTFTANADGTITLTRNSSGSSQAVWLYDADAAILIDDFCTGGYVFDTGVDDQNVRFRLSKLDNGSNFYVRDNAVIPSKGTYTGINVSISVDPGFTGTLTIRPMICSKDVYAISPKSIGYRPTYDEMWAAIKALQ